MKEARNALEKFHGESHIRRQVVISTRKLEYNIINGGLRSWGKGFFL
jgi:hypothetical protein